MIKTEDVYKSLLTLIREDRRGLALSEDEFNRLARICNERVLNKKQEEFETDTDNIDTLARFKTLETPIVLVAGSCSLPSDYRDIIGKPRIVDSGGITRRCDLVSQLEKDERTDDYLTQPTQTYPVYTIGDSDISENLILHVYPTTITGNITIDYLRNPQIPFLDYFINDTTLVATYMVADAVAVPIPAGYTYRDKTPGATSKDSLTKEFEWDDMDMQLILSIFCELYGIALPDNFLVQVSNAEEIKNT
jgi:hypothetical protein